ncbi:hypothetical protein [Flammeovirga sp. SubArs3]|uniref:hypothetical protein n=1 Tax=Flammeovirga sp. SubArs3 TaxID=2995316 RepID=UPI00248AA33E|nr:hypothetical protein [Flammeovirga sp. SubArs3]
MLRYNSPYLFFIFLFFCITSTINAQFLEEENYKFQEANNVLHKIAFTKGDNRPIPQLKISIEPKYVAKYYPGESQHFIYLDEKVYDLCATLGSDSLNALACIIGHELGHYYEDHIQSFGLSDTDVTHSKTELEDDADKFGLFYGAVAGFNTPKTFAKILDKIYDEYHRDSHLKGYPELKQRKKIINKAINEVDVFIHVYKVGQMLYAIGKYEEAYQCLEYILNHYPSKLIYNNLGVCQLKIYMNKVQSKEIYPYIYPFEFDVRVKRKVPNTDLRSRDFNFSEIDLAIQNFKKAIQLDPLYETGYINLACAYSIKGNQDAASGTIFELETELQLEGKTISENAYMVKGISKALNENYEEASKYFQHLTTNSDINNYNKKVLDAEVKKENSYFDNFMAWVEEYISTETPIEKETIVINSNKEKIRKLLPKDLEVDKRFHKTDLGNWSMLYYSEQDDYSMFIFRGKTTEIKLLEAMDNYPLTTQKGIKVKDNIAKVRSSEYYGYPTFRWNNKPHTILTYDTGRIAFTFEDQKLVNWFRWEVLD